MTLLPRRRLVDIGALALFLIGSVAVHSPAVFLGLIPIQDDVRVHYFPLLRVTSEALASGHLPLWTPAIFGGYPLFADGEAGMLYPLHLITLPWLSSATSLVLLRVIHTFLAGAFTYLLLRVLGAGWLAGLVAGTTFALSGFAAGQVVHTNVFHAMVWLPLELLLAERAVATRSRRLRYAILLGSIFGVQALALHVQVTLMSALAVGSFVVARCMVDCLRSRPEPPPPPALPRGLLPSFLSSVQRGFRGLATGASVLLGVGLVGVGLSAVQLFPLYELAGLTFRGSGLASEAAATNSVWGGALIRLLLPDAFDTATRGFWGPWVKWETVTYVGIFPLVLAAVGMVGRVGAYRWYFIGLAALALLAAMGPHSPIPLWSLLHSIPGFGGLQAPGRFSLLFSLAIAILAGYGVDWFLRRASTPQLSHRLSLAATVLALLGCAALGLSLERAASDLRAGSPVLDGYLAVPGVPGAVDGAPLTPGRVRDLAAAALTTSNPSTRRQLAVLVIAVGVVGLWQLAARFGRRGLAISTGCGAIAGLGVFADLWLATLTFHPLARVDTLAPTVPPVLSQAGKAHELSRVYTPRSVDDKSSAVEPNRLLPTGVQEAGGYSSLEMDRHTAFARAVEYSDNHLLDLWNVRYVIQPRVERRFPSYGGTLFHPQRPLFTGKWGTPGAGGTLLPEGGPVEASEVDVVAALWEAAEVAEGSRVGRLVVEGRDGERVNLSLRAGRHVSDAGFDLPESGQTFRHGRAEVAFRYQTSDPRGERYGEQLYYARLSLNPPMVVSRITVEKAGRAGGLEVFGIGLVGASNGEVTQVRQKEKYQQVYEDRSIRIFENTSVMPRVFLVGEAWQAPKGSDVLALMLDGPFDPREAAIVECEPAGAGCAPLLTDPTPSPAPSTQRGTAGVLRYESSQVTVQTVSAIPATLVFTDTYSPGWRAFVDDRPAPLLRSDYLFRAVAVPAGTHSVRFSYEPMSVALGILASLSTWCVVSVMLAVWLLQGAHARWPLPAWSWPPIGGPAIPGLRRPMKPAGDSVHPVSAE